MPDGLPYRGSTPRHRFLPAALGRRPGALGGSFGTGANRAGDRVDARTAETLATARPGRLDLAVFEHLRASALDQHRPHRPPDRAFVARPSASTFDVGENGGLTNRPFRQATFSRQPNRLKGRRGLGGPHFLSSLNAWFRSAASSRTQEHPDQIHRLEVGESLRSCRCRGFRVRPSPSAH